MKLYLLRHGESKGNKEGRFRGRTDYPLTDTGVEQAKSAGHYLKNFAHIDAVYASPMKRAVQTCEAVCNIIDKDFTIMEEFNNIMLGAWEGQPKDAIRKQYPKQWDIWINNPEELNIEGMESIGSISKRVMKGIDIIKEKNEENVLIVTHRAILKPLIASMIGIEKPSFWRIHIDTAALTVLQWREPTGWIMKNLNINHYLREFTEETV